MYTPSFNQVTDRSTLLETMRAHSFAILFGPGADGTPTATHLPLVVRDEGPHGVLEGHFARANAHRQGLDGRETLVVFPGPHAYVSPSLYAEQLSVPTWNYIAVHAYGTLERVDDEPGKLALLDELIQCHDRAFAAQWADLPEGFRRTMLGNITGFRIPIARIEGKFKLSQNRSEIDRKSVREAHATGSPDARALAAWMARLGV
ncbi:MAG TPA: FMN-binding negative transcriptional regulator [Terracidiphilus sp.]|nr:FMN-binding negative transcriptional regulator [Terracidiphilus sp.]